MKQSRVLFFDFDGVIKDSVEVKGEAFYQLFEPFGFEIAALIRAHHLQHGGISRFEKIPQYLKWCGLNHGADIVEEYSNRFSQLVVERVVQSPWVPGVENYLRTNPFSQLFFLVSATPVDELRGILQRLNLLEVFIGVDGAPLKKGDAIRMALDRFCLDPSVCLMIGDARNDYDAALQNGIRFLLRKNISNAKLFANYDGPSFIDFNLYG